MFKPDRLITLCDGVVAIAITLLVLGLEVPSAHKVTDKELSEYLVEMRYPLLAYAVSFVLIGTYWLQHYVLCHYVERVDRGFIAVNGLFLLCVSFVPFPTGLQATYRHDKLAMLLYGATQALCGLSLLAIWLYATTRQRLVSPDISPAVVRSITRRILITPLVSLIAIACLPISMDVSRLLFLAIPFAQFSHRAADDGWAQPGDVAASPTRDVT
ncbi:MAG: DUF1211 domain-containing protein [Pirellulales bacterium]|nr:DUF1211 domain-containing protein [Pirellulales bacterium]